MEHLALAMGVIHNFSLAYMHESNGQIERCIKETQRHLRAMILSDRIPKECWRSLLPMVMRIINSTKHSATGFAPVEILFGDKVNLNRMLLPKMVEMKMKPGKVHQSMKEYYDSLVNAQKELIDISNEHLQKVLELRVHKASQVPKIKQGEYVFQYIPIESRKDKLAPRKRGPFQVLEWDEDSTTALVRKLWEKKFSSKANIRLPKRLLTWADMSRVDSPEEFSSAMRDEYVVEEILDHETYNSKNKTEWLFLVKWEGYDIDQSTWEPYLSLKEVEALDTYAAKFGIKI